jgi:ABC-type polysaccharide/polyol phosphate transport system ATPase subunit
MPDKDIAIKVENISKTFRIPHEKISTLKGAFVSALKSHEVEEFKALDDVSFEVKKGEFFGIIGRNGSGKSTLLKILAGIYQPSKGEVKVNGLISPFLELGIGFNPELSGRDNVYLNAAVLGLTHKQINEKFDDIVEFSELRRFIDQKVKNYSSGMQVRLMFSTAIHANREILLMDEVLAVGDSNFQSKCMEEFNEYKDAGKTVILVTHDIAMVQRYCDRAMLMRNGKIEMIGDPQKVGNEYIYQNMSDEERRITDEEIKQGKKEGAGEKKNKIAEITNVEFLDDEGKGKNIFRTGESINVLVTYNFLRETRDPEFGIIVKDNQKRNIFTTNTIFKKIKAGVIKKGVKTISFKFENVLSSGEFFVTAAVSSSGGKAFFDWKDEIACFRVMNEYNSGGIVDLKHNITI